jgi:uncharacterized membrane-anchored protein YhcB (DUF1043 family)
MAFDAWGFLAAAPHWLVYLAALVGLLLGAWWISRLSRQISYMVSTFETLSDMRGEFDEHAKLANSHYKHIEILASEEHWKTCDINKCIHFQQIFNKIEKIQERFDQFDQRANETRTNTATSLDGLREGQRELAKEMGRELSDLAKQLITVLAENIRRK